MSNRTAACIITNNNEVLIGFNGEQHRDLIIDNNLTKDEDIIGYYDYYSPFTFIPNCNHYLLDEERCNNIIDDFLLNGGISIEKNS